MSAKPRKSAKAPSAKAAPPASTIPDADVPVSPASLQRDWAFAFLPEAEPEIVDERALHALMKDWRHGRATRTLGQVLGDAYYLIFIFVVLGAMVANVIVQSQGNAAACTTASCLAGRTLVPWALLFATVGVVTVVARIFGPVLASAAEGFWLLEAPLHRDRLLRPRLVGIVAASFVIAAGVAALVAALSGVAPLAVAGFALASGAAASATMAWAALDQAAERSWPGRVVQVVASVLALGAVVAMVAVASGRLALVAPGWAEQAPWVVAAVGAVATVLGVVLARGRLDEIRRARLLSGGSLVSGMQGAMFALDLGLARDILVERDAVARGHVRPVRGRGVGLGALVWRDVQRLARFPKPLIGLGAAMLVPYAVEAVGLGSMNPFFGPLGLVAALIPFFGALRVLTRTGGLARMMPFSTAQLRTATMIVPGMLALVWVVAILPALLGLVGPVTRTPVDAALTAVAMGAAGVLGAVRWQTSKQVNFDTPMMATSAGAVPPTLILNLFRGFDVVALIAAPTILGATPAWSLGMAVAVFLFLRAGFNVGEMQAEAEETRRELEAEKAKASGEKIKVSRPAR